MLYNICKKNYSSKESLRLPLCVVDFGVELVEMSLIFSLHKLPSQTQISIFQECVPLSRLSCLHPTKPSSGVKQSLLQMFSSMSTLNQIMIKVETYSVIDHNLILLVYEIFED